VSAWVKAGDPREQRLYAHCHGGQRASMLLIPLLVIGVMCTKQIRK